MTEQKDNGTVTETVEQSADDYMFEAAASFAQQRLWFLDQLEPGLAVYNINFALELTGPLNTKALQAALDMLGEAGFDPVYGARPLKRAIQSQLENPLAQEILAGRFGPGSMVRVDVEGGQLTFIAAQGAAESAA